VSSERGELHVVPGELLSVEGLSKHFPVARGVFGRTIGNLRAVDDVSFRLQRGETLGLVGESGCGKTTTGRAVLRLIEPSAGRIVFDGTDLTALSEHALRSYRRRMQIVFQDPFGSLNPRLRVVDLIGEGLERHGLASGAAVEREVRALLARVGLPGGWVGRHPHELSGGQRQRVGIARAIAVQPDLIVCDEAVSALDVSIQAQVVNLLVALRRELGLSYLFIAHDLMLVRHISDNVAVMYLGRIVEHAPSAELFAQPAHPYTRALLSAVPPRDPRARRRRVVLTGDVPTALAPPRGCHFHPRCPAVLGRCSEAPPPVVALAGGRRTLRCVHGEGLEGEANWYSLLERRLRNAEAARRSTVAVPSEPLAARPEGLAGGVPMAALVAPMAHAAPALPPLSALPERSPLGAERAEALPPLARGLIGLSLVAIGASLTVLGRPVLGLVAIAAGGVVLALFAPSLMRRGGFLTRRLGRTLALVWVLAALLSLLFLPLRRTARARADLAWLRGEVDAYARNVGRPPRSLTELRFRSVERFGMGAPRDPWGQPYRYHPPDELASNGPDGVPSADDLQN
jgi:oligopeptide/dipeptide ABC transporter ATP-binding protein